MRCARVFVMVGLGLVGCKGSGQAEGATMGEVAEQQPAPSAPTEVAKPEAPEAKAEAEVVAKQAEAELPATETSEGGPSTETGGGEMETSGETGADADADAPPVIEFDPNADPVLTLLGEGRPELVKERARHEHGRKLLVLYTIDIEAKWKASLPETDAVEADLEALEEILSNCDDQDEHPGMMAECRLEAVKEAKLSPRLIPADVVETWAHESQTWELAEVELPRDPNGKPKLVQRKRLIDLVFGAGNNYLELPEIKLKPYDMDGDKRSEILVVFPVSDLSESYLGYNEGAVAFILDRADFHIQFATTRLYHEEESDLSWHQTHVETTFQAKTDVNGDGYKDLVVRENELVERHGGEADDNDWKKRKRRETTCLYELAGDLWSCPENLGTHYVSGAHRVERTSVPVPVPEPEAPPAGG